MGTQLEQEPLSLKVTEAGEVVLIKGAERISLGSKDEVCEVLADFLAGVDYGEG